MKKNIVPILLIIIGISLSLTSFAIKGYSKKKEIESIARFNEKLALQEKEEEKEEQKNKEEEDEIVEIAIIEIPSIDLKSVIVEGIEKEKLRYYLGHFEDTAMPGEVGNFSISGHSSVIYNEILNNLNKVEIGNEIKIETEKGEFIYIITEKFVVEPTEINVLNQDGNGKNMTIVTCTDNGKRRLIVRGEMK